MDSEAWMGLAALFAIVLWLTGGLWVMLDINSGVYLSDGNWQCTESRVVNDTLPRVEECVKYERKKD